VREDALRLLLEVNVAAQKSATDVAAGVGMAGRV